MGGASTIDDMAEHGMASPTTMVWKMFLAERHS